MRNVLIHDYDDVSFAEVAGTIENDLPTLYAALLGLIEQDPTTATLPRNPLLPLREHEITAPEPPFDLDPEF